MSHREAAGGSDPAGRADAAARLVGTNPPLAQAVALEAVAAARAAGDARAAAQAYRAHGRAALELGRLDEATRSFRTAVRAAERDGEPATAAECRVSLAYALSERGRTAPALRELDRAATVLRGQQAAGVLMQRGLVLWRCGRTDEALESYRRALPTLRRGPDRLVEARLYNNRSLRYVDRAELAAAEADLRKVAELCRAEGQDVLAADAETNLGYVAFRRGDAPAALGFLDSAESTYPGAGGPAPRAAAHPGRAAAVGGRLRRGASGSGWPGRPARRARCSTGRSGGGPARYGCVRCGRPVTPSWPPRWPSCAASQARPSRSCSAGGRRSGCWPGGGRWRTGSAGCPGGRPGRCSPRRPNRRPSSGSAPRSAMRCWSS